MDARPGFIIRELALGALAIVEFALVAIVLVLGVGFSPVVSGSMGDALPVGSVAISVSTPTSALAKGDVVQLAVPDDNDRIYVHRIEDIQSSSHGTTVHTKGDANPMQDPWTATIVSAHTPKVIGFIPAIGFVHNWGTAAWMRYLILGLVIALLALVCVRLMVAARDR